MAPELVKSIQQGGYDEKLNDKKITFIISARWRMFTYGDFTFLVNVFLCKALLSVCF